jgi:hypothetical protein
MVMQNFDRRSVVGLGITAVGAFAAQSASAQTAAPAAVTYPRKNPVWFWNEVSLELNALDHSINPDDARAPGPVASARALGLIHAAIADAVHFAYKTTYSPHIFKDGPSGISFPDLFVAGAAERVMSFIFDTQTHLQLIGQRRSEYFRLVNATNTTDWGRGQAFVERHLVPKYKEDTGEPDEAASTIEKKKSLWDRSRIERMILPKFSDYIPRPRRHDQDPYHATQGFYGQKWGTETPLVLSSDEVTDIVNNTIGTFHKEGSTEYQNDLNKVKTIGSTEARRKDENSPETRIGLFWAYDGARLLGTPPRLYNQILRKIAEEDNLDIPRMARMFAVCNLAMADAGIVAWKSKYDHNIWRPVLGIQNQNAGSENWRPFGAPSTNRPDFDLALKAVGQLAESNQFAARQFVFTQSILGASSPISRSIDDLTNYRKAAFTPNFPAFPSGHATFGSACFNTLKTVRGKGDFQGPLLSEELDGSAIDNYEDRLRPRVELYKNSNLDVLIKDNNDSRVYLGVHWLLDATRGSAGGKKVAEAVVDRAYKA